MPFERSFKIERRLADVLRLIGTGRYSTPMLAEEVGVSIPTISRCVTALRLRGHEIRAEMREGGWRYVLAGKTVGPQKLKAGPFTDARQKSNDNSGTDC